MHRSASAARLGIAATLTSAAAMWHSVIVAAMWHSAPKQIHKKILRVAAMCHSAKSRTKKILLKSPALPLHQL
jgi:hypothetical protein